MRNLLCLFAFVGAIGVGPAWAQVQRSGGDGARVMAQVQQLTAERAQLQAENAKIKAELDAAQKELSAAKSDLKKLKASQVSWEQERTRLSASSASEKASTEEQLAKQREQMQELIGKFRDTAQALRTAETGQTEARNQLAQRDRDLKACVKDNLEFYDLNAEILDRMENRGLWSQIAEREPFTKLKRQRLENLVDDYRYRADDLKIDEKEGEQRASTR